MAEPLPASLATSLQRLTHRLQELDLALADPAVAADLKRYRELSREHAEIAHICQLHAQLRQRGDDLASAQQLWDEASGDEGMQALARQEMQESQADVLRLTQALQTALLPKDPDDARNAFVEIRAGTGGEESALFAADLARMYTRYAERQSWRTEIVSSHPSDLGGYKEIILLMESSSGPGVYGQLKFESGGHRVQRVPATEAQGRVHTSACTVAVMPQPDEAEEQALQASDLRIDTFRASGAGGQHINKTDSAVRITHLPTGLVAECQDDRSQHRNKAKAMAVLAARLREREHQQRQSQEAATRRALVGSGDRSDRIRTYNFPQGRLSDHRVQLTLYKLGAVMDGALDEVLAALQTAQAAEQLAQLEAQHGL